MDQILIILINYIIVLRYIMYIVCIIIYYCIAPYHYCCRVQSVCTSITTVVAALFSYAISSRSFHSVRSSVNPTCLASDTPGHSRLLRRPEYSLWSTQGRHWPRHRLRLYMAFMTSFVDYPQGFSDMEFAWLTISH